MKNIRLKIVFAILLICFSGNIVYAQNSTTAPSNSFNTKDLPQWAKDLRRWDIVAFGTFPFTMFTAIFAMDTYRWAEQGMDWSDSGRRYAPWPLKSAGAVDMTNKQYEMTMMIAAGMSITIAIIDLIIVKIKQNRAQQWAESLPAGTTIITTKPWLNDSESETDNSTEEMRE